MADADLGGVASEARQIEVVRLLFHQEPPVAAGQQNRGATHTAELNYVFNNLLPGTAWTEADCALADAMSSYWVNFATTGDPNGKGLPAWPVYRDKASGRAMVLGGGKIEPEAAPSERDVAALYDSLWKHQMSPAVVKTRRRPLRKKRRGAGRSRPPLRDVQDARDVDRVIPYGVHHDVRQRETVRVRVSPPSARRPRFGNVSSDAGVS